VPDFHSWTDEDLEHYADEQARAFRLKLAVEKRPPLGDDSPTVWVAALKQMNIDASLAPNGVVVLGCEALSRHTALVGLAQLLDTMPAKERAWFMPRRPA
jgi:hypothetical protein